MQGVAMTTLTVRAEGQRRQIFVDSQRKISA